MVSWGRCLLLALVVKVWKNSLPKSVCLHAKRGEEGVFMLLNLPLVDLPCPSINKTTCRAEDWPGSGEKSASLLEAWLELWAQLDRHVLDSPCLRLYPNHWAISGQTKDTWINLQVSFWVSWTTHQLILSSSPVISISWANSFDLDSGSVFQFLVSEVNENTLFFS